jgi:GTP-binding protein HflX
VITIKINGNISSLKKSTIEQLELLYDYNSDSSTFVNEELVIKMAELTSLINRELAVHIDKKGKIVDVSVGDNATVSLPEIDGRRDSERLTGVRCVHTHPNGDAMLSDVDINALLSLKLDAMVSIGVNDGNVTGIYAAILAKDDNGEFTETEIYGPYTVGSSRLDALLKIIRERDEASGTLLFKNNNDLERAILVGIETGRTQNSGGKSEGQNLLDELEELARTAGAIVLKKVLQKKTVKDAAFLIGRGKVEELGLLRQALNVNLIIFDDELSGAQVRNIEEITGIKVIDRTTLILDIFAQRARSREGKLQVELAQLKYLLPRLMGMGTQLSRLGGGIGTRGPGESKLEVDRRHIRRKINILESELSNIEKRREIMRRDRIKSAIPVIALVGYTNSGKSTIMNKLCGSDVLAENKLFATLDPTIRKLSVAIGKDALLIDTVGFIRKLPHELIESFKSTLEETIHADVLLHVVDASSGETSTQINTVNEILESLNALNKSMIIVLNKIDLLKDEHARVPVECNGNAVFEVSALTGQGMDKLLEHIGNTVMNEEVDLELLIPYNEGWAVSYAFDNAKIIESTHIEGGTKVRLSILKRKADKLSGFILTKS